MSTELNPRECLWERIKDIRFAMFVTHADDGHLHARPMTTQNRRIDEDETLWFFTSRGGDPAREIALDAVVNIAFADPGSDRYVSTRTSGA